MKVVKLTCCLSLPVTRKLQLPVAVAAPPPQDPQLLPAKLCGKVAEHCNEKRLSARKAQDASLRLYLCCLLRR